MELRSDGISIRFLTEADAQGRLDFNLRNSDPRLVVPTRAHVKRD